jgi:hypothetical protein
VELGMDAGGDATDSLRFALAQDIPERPRVVRRADLKNLNSGGTEDALSVRSRDASAGRP